MSSSFYQGVFLATGSLQADLKGLYWQHDRPKNTIAALHQLIHDAQAGKIDLNVYVLQYTIITDALVSQGALSALDQVHKFLDDLLGEHRMKVLSFCAKNDCKLSAQDVGTMNSNYEELKQFVLHETQTLQMRAIYDKEQMMREGQPIPEVSIMHRSTLTGFDAIVSGASTSATSSLSSSTFPTPQTSSIPSIPAPPDFSRVDSVAEFMKQTTQLSLSLQAAIQK